MEWKQPQVGRYFRYIDEDHIEIYLVTSVGSVFYLSSGIVPLTTLSSPKLDELLNAKEKEYGFAPSKEEVIMQYADSNFLLETKHFFEDYKDVIETVKKDGMPSLNLPLKMPCDSEWKRRFGRDHESIIFVKKVTDIWYEAVQIWSYRPDQPEGYYMVQYRKNEYNHLNEQTLTALEFVEELGKNPIDDLEVEAYEFSTHGASGMDKNYRDLKSLDEAKEILSTVYGADRKSVV